MRDSTRCWKAWRLTISLLVALTLALAPVVPVRGQMAVVDVGAITQLALNLQQTVRLVANSTRDLAAMAEMGQVLTMVQELQSFAVLAQQMYAQLDTLRQGWLMLSDPSNLPGTAAALYSWRQQAEMWALQGARTGLQSFDAIMGSVVTLFNTMIAILGRISSILGSVGGLQYVSGLLTAGLAQAEQLKAFVIAGQHQLIGPQMIDRVIALSYPAIIQHEMRGWGQP